MSKVKNTGPAAASTTSSTKDPKHKGDHSSVRTSGGALAIGGSLGAKSAEWIERMPMWAKRTAFYMLLFSGVYWILAGWFSSWGDVMYPLGRFGLTAFGAGLLYLAMLVQHDPTADVPQEYKELADDVLLERGRANFKYGAYWCLGGLAVTAYTYMAASGGGTYVVAWGAIVYGALQCYQGYSQMHIVQKRRK